MMQKVGEVQCANLLAIESDFAIEDSRCVDVGFSGQRVFLKHIRILRNGIVIVLQVRTQSIEWESPGLMEINATHPHPWLIAVRGKGE